MVLFAFLTQRGVTFRFEQRKTSYKLVQQKPISNHGLITACCLYNGKLRSRLTHFQAYFLRFCLVNEQLHVLPLLLAFLLAVFNATNLNILCSLKVVCISVTDKMTMKNLILLSLPYSEQK